VDPSKAKASFKNGVITIRLPKSEAVEGRVIPIEKE
jgi:HSP20 family molecular chaperone IbpA